MESDFEFELQQKKLTKLKSERETIKKQQSTISDRILQRATQLAERKKLDPRKREEEELQTTTDEIEELRTLDERHLQKLRDRVHAVDLSITTLEAEIRTLKDQRELESKHERNRRLRNKENGLEEELWGEEESDTRAEARDRECLRESKRRENELVAVPEHEIMTERQLRLSRRPSMTIYDTAREFPFPSNVALRFYMKDQRFHAVSFDPKDKRKIVGKFLPYYLLMSPSCLLI